MIRNLGWLVFFGLLFFSSCNTYKNLTYLEGVDKSPRDSLYAKQKTEYIIQPHDNLYIRIKTNNEETDQFYNINSSGSNSMNSSMMSGGNMYMYGYYVSDSGFIEMPVLGYIKVGGLTLPEVKKTVEEKVKVYLKEAYVQVKAPGFSYTTLGEIKTTGTHTFNGEELNIIDALALAGGITDYGLRNQVVIMRQKPEGIYSYTVDLTQDDILGSPDFYVMPNDIIYVKPMKVKVFKIRSGDVLSVLSTFTSLASIILLIFTLNNTK